MAQSKNSTASSRSGSKSTFRPAARSRDVDNRRDSADEWNRPTQGGRSSGYQSFDENDRGSIYGSQSGTNLTGGSRSRRASYDEENYGSGFSGKGDRTQDSVQDRAPKKALEKVPKKYSSERSYRYSDRDSDNRYSSSGREQDNSYGPGRVDERWGSSSSRRGYASRDRDENREYSSQPTGGARGRYADSETEDFSNRRSGDRDQGYNVADEHDEDFRLQSGGRRSLDEDMESGRRTDDTRFSSSDDDDDFDEYESQRFGRRPSSYNDR